jgi:acyl carrier protein
MIEGSARYHAAMVERAAVFDVVERTIHKDLKLAGARVDDSTRMVGGDLELDSLDLLMLVTGIEKAFGVKLPANQLGPQTMATVGAFVDFAHGRIASNGQAEGRS